MNLSDKRGEVSVLEENRQYCLSKIRDTLYCECRVIICPADNVLVFWGLSRDQSLHPGSWRASLRMKQRYCEFFSFLGHLSLIE